MTASEVFRVVRKLDILNRRKGFVKVLKKVRGLFTTPKKVLDIVFMRHYISVRETLI